MKSTLWLLLAWIALMPTARAHRPYEVPRGSFIRPDGTPITIVQCCGDGILGRDPCRIEFRKPGGETITATSYLNNEIVVDVLQNEVQIFEYPSQWIPIASTVHAFDGSKITTGTTSGQGLRSVLIHTHSHLQSYFVSFCLSCLPFGGILLMFRVKKSDFETLLRVVLISLSFLTGGIAFLSILGGDISPLILALPLATLWIPLSLLHTLRNLRMSNASKTQ